MKRIIASVLATVTILAALALALGGAASADHQPADKVIAAGNTLELFTCDSKIDFECDTTKPNLPTGTQTLLTGTLKTSSPTDLMLHVSLECALWTNVKVSGNNSSSAFGQVKVWVEIDGNPVPVAAGDNGEVVFCEREFKLETTNFDDTDATIALFQRTRSANAFNWLALDLGSGVHTVEVKAALDRLVDGNGLAAAAVGKRTLIVEPAKLANDASL